MPGIVHFCDVDFDCNDRLLRLMLKLVGIYWLLWYLPSIYSLWKVPGDASREPKCSWSLYCCLGLRCTVFAYNSCLAISTVYFIDYTTIYRFVNKKMVDRNHQPDFPHFCHASGWLFEFFVVSMFLGIKQSSPTCLKEDAKVK